MPVAFQIAFPVGELRDAHVVLCGTGRTSALSLDPWQKAAVRQRLFRDKEIASHVNDRWGHRGRVATNRRCLCAEIVELRFGEDGDRQLPEKATLNYALNDNLGHAWREFC